MAKSRESIVEIPFPAKGLYAASSYAAQPQGTSADLLNVRAYDPVTGRMRGSSRSGLTKYLSSQIAGDASIQEINHIVLPFFDPPGPGEVLLGRQTGAGTGSYTILDDVGVVVATGGTAAYLYQGSVWDEDGNVYVVYENTSTRVMSIQSRTKAGVLRWTVTPATWNDTSDDLVRGLQVVGGILYVFTQDITAFSTSNRSGVLRFYADDGSAVGANPWFEWSDITLLPSLNVILPNNMAAYTQGLLGLMCTTSGAAVVRVISLETGDERDISLFEGSTFNEPISLAADLLGNFYGIATSESSATCRIWKVGSDGTAHWNKDGGAADKTSMTCVAYDSENNRLGVVGSNVRNSGHSFATVSVSTGNVVASSDYGGETDWYAIACNGNGGFVVGRGSGTNDFSGMGSDLVEDWAIDNSTLYERHFLSVNNREEVPDETTTEFNRRQIRSIIVSGGTVKRLDQDGTLSTPTSGSNALSASANLIFSAEHSQDLYFADGISQKVYDSATNTVSTWTASAGSLPEDSGGNRPRLIARWRGRIVLSGLPRDPQNWFMSAVDDPTDWDYSPASPTATQAVAGNNSDAGKIGDIINAIVPFTDDELIFGGDHTLHLMRGDPIAGGQIDLITNSVGMAWGRPYAMDPFGSLWFMSSRGPVYKMSARQPQPERISQAIDRELEATDFNTHAVCMGWDDICQGMHLFISPLDSTATATHWFYDARTGGWFKDRFADEGHNPKIVHVFDGDDPEDRVLLLGSWDGYLRKFDKDADDDDGSAIASHVLIGPLQLKSAEGFRLKELECTLAEDSDAITWALQVGNTAETAASATPVVMGTFDGGRNRTTRPRRFGHAAYLKLSQSTLNKSWSLERLQALISPTGRIRRRAG